MAATVIKPSVLKVGEAFEAPDFQALDGSLGAVFEHKYKDARTLIMVQNTNSGPGTLTVTKGDTWQSCAADRTFQIQGNKTAYFNLDSGRHMHMNGINKGMIEFKGPATLKIAVVVLP